MERYIGQVIDVIYLDVDNKTKQRKIEVLAIENGPRLQLRRRAAFMEIRALFVFLLYCNFLSNIL
ncbi:hypothetical protein ACFCP7_28960, partial [Paenibacillus elgii]